MIVFLAQLSEGAAAAQQAIKSTTGRSDPVYLAVIVIILMCLFVGLVFHWLRTDTNAREIWLKEAMSRVGTATEIMAQTSKNTAAVLEKMENNDRKLRSSITHLINAGQEMIRKDDERAEAELMKASQSLS